MSKTHKIYNWDEWKELCEEHNENPHEIADLSLPARRQIGGGDTEDFEYVGYWPEKEVVMKIIQPIKCEWKCPNCNKTNLETYCHMPPEKSGVQCDYCGKIFISKEDTPGSVAQYMSRYRAEEG